MPSARFEGPCETDHYTDGQMPSEDDLLATLEEVVSVLEGHEVDHVLMGGIGSFALARPRETHDIDVFLRPGDVDPTLDLLEQRGFEVSVHDPAWLAKAWKRGVLTDLVFRSSGEIYLDDEMVERAERRDYKGVSARVIAPEDLIVIKALATAERTAHHWYDALAIISRCELDWEYLVRRAIQAGPRRVLSLLLYAESCDVAVPATAITAVHDTLHGGAVA
ncbi:MAG TPA: nucleotidyltransferase [Acidimicrobiales bacterium]|nr:nucleotidyltransferase [Acidimicrobiales bacterium]